MKGISRRWVLGVMVCALIGCASIKRNTTQSAIAYLVNSKGQVIGEVRLTEQKSGVLIKASISRLSPGLHGFHIHELGLCEPPGFQTAGGHFNPHTKEHGTHNPRGFHMGDLPNLEANEAGEATLTFIIEKASLNQNLPQSLLREGGTAFIIHEKADDYVSNPSGNAGRRVACGIIRADVM